MSFNDMLSGDAAAFMDLGGESITYTPRGGVARSITAIITRRPPLPIPEENHIRGMVVEVECVNSNTTGVDLSRTDVVGGKFAIPLRAGHATTKELSITEDAIAESDAGMSRFKFGV